MNMCKYSEEWIYEDLLNLPKEESSEIEYKSSKISLDNLKNKISVAASSFWNSGGGVFIAGVNDNGIIDGGISSKKGRQSIRDWADNAIKLTEPLGEYQIYIVEGGDCTSKINDDKVVLIIRFNKSNLVPHMAYDNKYYIRAGAHSDSATHFQVEALRSLRQFTKPNLRGIMRKHSNKPKVEELVIVALNDATALNIKLNFKPLPLALKNFFDKDFPLEIPIINKNNPFNMDISLFGARKESFGIEPVTLILTFNDILGNVYEVEQLINPHKNLQPMEIGEDINLRLVKAIENLTKKLNN